MKYENEDRFLNDPQELERQLAQLNKETKWVVIDEIQKVPRLLDIVHRWIEKKRFHFALTGSSARKLKHGSANLLAGRAFVLRLFPFTYSELQEDFQLTEALRFGSLPGLFELSQTKEKKQFLEAYSQTYLKEEIFAEQLVRKITPFRRFLEVAATESGEIINYSNIAAEVGVDRASIKTYYEILEDTLVGRLLEPFHRSLRKRQRHNPKFYFFDNGVKNALSGMLDLPTLPKTAEYGKAFEHLVINEIFHRAEYHEKTYRFSYLRTGDNVEIDLIIERQGMPISLIEIKSSKIINEKHVRNLQRFSSEIKNSNAYCLSLETKPKKIGKVVCLHWQDGIKELGLEDI